jgi:ATP-dependent DNA helicase DinG
VLKLKETSAESVYNLAEYIADLEAENKNSFMHFMLPNALLKVRQGFGRLIRSKKDKGVVIILDKRVITTRYGNYFKQVLPAEMTVVKNDLELIDRTNLKKELEK